MCEKCDDYNELQAMLYEEWRKQEGIVEGAMVSDTVQTAFLGNSDGVLILQKSYDRSQLTVEGGGQPLPDTQVNAIHVPADEVEDFIGELIGAAGPKVFMKMLSDSLDRIGIEGDDDE